MARASGVDPAVLAAEAAGTLASFAGDHAGMVTACRRLVQRHPLCGPLWWLAGRVLCGDDPRAEAWAAAEDLDADPTGRQLSHALPSDATVVVLGWPTWAVEAFVPRGDLEVLVVDSGGEAAGLVARLERSDVPAWEVPERGLGAAVVDADIVLLEATAMGPEAAVTPSGGRAAAAVARQAGRPTWLVAGVGRRLPARVFAAVADALAGMGEPWDLDDELVPLDLIDTVVTPSGVGPVADAVAGTDCPVAPELLRTTPSFSGRPGRGRHR